MNQRNFFSGHNQRPHKQSENQWPTNHGARIPRSAHRWQRQSSFFSRTPAALSSFSHISPTQGYQSSNISLRWTILRKATTFSFHRKSITVLEGRYKAFSSSPYLTKNVLLTIHSIPWFPNIHLIHRPIVGFGLINNTRIIQNQIIKVVVL